MLSHYQTGCIVAGLLSVAHMTSSSPLVPVLETRDSAGTLFTRGLDGYDDCTADQEARLGRGFADAATLARWPSDHPIDTSSTAYIHYLRPEDKTLALSLWDVLHLVNQPTNARFHFRVRCSTGGSECPTGSLAITDSTPRSGDQVAVMVICPLFFTAAETEKDLDSKPLVKDPKRNKSSWCQPGPRFNDFETAGHTLLHEMTHLDAVGAAAGLSVRKGTHGTDDVGGFGSIYQPAARALKKFWDDGKANDATLKPLENAESVAATATEWYFVQNCGFDEIAS